jgi:hypothetical protein
MILLKCKCEECRDIKAAIATVSFTVVILAALITVAVIFT